MSSKDNRFRDWSPMRNSYQVSNLQIQSKNVTTRRDSRSKHIPIFANRNSSQTYYKNNNSIIINPRLTHQEHVPIFKRKNNFT
mgnify:CR=1 FL=1